MRRLSIKLVFIGVGVCRGRRTNRQMKLVMICFHNVNICRAARGAGHMSKAPAPVLIYSGAEGVVAGAGGAGRGAGAGPGRVLRSLPYVRVQRV